MKRFASIPRRLFLDESGFIASAELVLLATILTVGAIAGLVTVRDAVVTELGDLGSALKRMNQSYSYANVETPCGNAAGSQYIDFSDFCTPGRTDDDPPQQLPPIVIDPPLPPGAGGGEG
jgi:Flp pilus assembly pilin Flp